MQTHKLFLGCLFLISCHSISANPCLEFAELIKGQQDFSNVRLVAISSHDSENRFQIPTNARMRRTANIDQDFCRIEGIIETEIAFELWLPNRDEWNGRYLGVGNGGEAGWINYTELQRGLGRNFATASTDTGHKSEDTHWALGHPDRVENFGHRAHHLLAVTVKALIAEYYQQAQQYSYFIGCSGGGLQGLNEAQRYPADYDGIITGAAGYSMVPLSARFILSGLLEQQKSAGNLSREQWQQVANDAVQSCDAKDGLADGIVNDPGECQFNIDVLDYLSAAQKERVKTLYGPLIDKQGKQLYPGFYPGIQFIPQARQMNVAGRSFGEWLYQDSQWRVQDFNLGRDVALAEAKLPGLRAANPDLEPFQRLGGKLISYIGWEDPTVPAQANIDYFDSVQSQMGGKTDDFFRLFMAPGMGHCRGGSGPDQFGQAFAGDAPIVDAEHDVLAAIMRWVEEGIAPNKIVASRIRQGEVDMTRPLCPYPQKAHYLGRGDGKQAQQFECR